MRQRHAERGSWRPPADRWSKADGAAMLEALRASGESDAQFSRRTGVGTHRIRYWRQKIGEGERGREALPGRVITGFVPMRVIEETQVRQEPSPDSRAHDREVEVYLRGGARLVFRGAWDADSLRPWMTALEAGHVE